MFFKNWTQMGGFELNHHWHGINVLSLLECALLAACLCTLLAVFAVRKSKRLAILSLVGALSFATAAYAANTALSALTASGALAGANLIYVVQTAGSGGVKATMTQVATFINSLFSGDATVSSGGAITFATVNANVGSFGSATTCTAFTTNAKGLITAASAVTCTPGIASVTGLGTGVATALGIAPGTTGSFATQNGAITTGNCLKWGPGVQDAGAICGSGGGGTGANPTATAGPTAVNGVATTFMRSDGAPAIQLGSGSAPGLVQCGLGLTCTSGVAASSVTQRNNTGTTDTLLSTDSGTVITESNAAPVAVGIAVASTAGFTTGNYWTVKNKGAGLVTITPTTSTIDGAATLTVKQNQSVDFYSDGTNYWTLPGRPTNVACADLTNGATGCSTTVGTAATAATGTSAHTLPFLDGTNTFSGVQTFGSVFGTVTTQSGTTYTLAASDCGTEIAFTNAAAVTVTIPAALTTGCNIAILQTTAGGQVTVTGTAVSAATLHSAHSYTKTFGQWAIIGINIYTTGVAILTGDGA